jgi:hypothetical protein
LSEFWTLTPFQVTHILRAHGLIARKGSANDLMRSLGAKARRVRAPESP